MKLYKFAEQTGHHQEAAKEHASPWKLGGLTPWQLSKRVYHEIDEDEVFTRSAALAYYFVSALFPMIFFLMAMLGLFAQSHDLQSSLINYAARFMPGDATSLVQKTLKEIANNSTGLKLAFGLALALWSGSGGIVSIMDALNRCYHVKDSRPWWKQRLMAIALTVAISALTIVALTIVLYGGDIVNFVGTHVGLSSLGDCMAHCAVADCIVFRSVIFCASVLLGSGHRATMAVDHSRLSGWRFDLDRRFPALPRIPALLQQL